VRTASGQAPVPMTVARLLAGLAGITACGTGRASAARLQLRTSSHPGPL